MALGFILGGRSACFSTGQRCLVSAPPHWRRRGPQAIWTNLPEVLHCTLPHYGKALKIIKGVASDGGPFEAVLGYRAQ